MKPLLMEVAHKALPGLFLDHGFPHPPRSLFSFHTSAPAVGAPLLPREKSVLLRGCGLGPGGEDFSALGGRAPCLGPSSSGRDASVWGLKSSPAAAEYNPPGSSHRAAVRTAVDAPAGMPSQDLPRQQEGQSSDKDRRKEPVTWWAWEAPDRPCGVRPGSPAGCWQRPVHPASGRF